MTDKEMFINELRKFDVDPWLFVTALVNAVDPEDQLELDDFFEVLDEGDMEWPADI